MLARRYLLIVAGRLLLSASRTSASPLDTDVAPAAAADVASTTSGDAAAKWRFERPIHPAVAFSTGSDGGVLGKVTVPFAFDHISGARKSGASVAGVTIGPTLSLAEAGKASLFSSGASTSTGQALAFGKTSVSGGVLGAYTWRSVLTEDEIAVLETADEAKKLACTKAADRCKDPIDPADKPFCDLLKGRDPKQFCTSIDVSELSPSGRIWFDQDASLKARQQEAAEARLRRYRFPVVDWSVWLGGGSTQFRYYDVPAAGTAPSNSAVGVRHGSLAWATQLTWVPEQAGNGRLGWTVEVPVSLQRVFQAGQKSAMPCTALASTALDGSILTSCGDSLPLGAPNLGAALGVGAAVGVVDRGDGRWRIALSFGLQRAYVTNTNTWSVGVPVYLNALTFSQAKGSDLTIDYAGIVRITPALQMTAPSPTPGWAFVINVALFAQGTLFPRADNLVR